MTTVKIVSNPYVRQMSFEVFDAQARSWLPINGRSKLLSDEIARGFLPFKAGQIVETICRELGSSDPINLIFEGCDDEYLELRQVCESDAFRTQVELQRSPLWLENARDILPQVVDVFKTLRPFFEQNVTDRGRIAEDLRKFSEASDDAIPICVLGNYSAGKSTFINALIGCELLPSGDAPITARVFQIRSSRQPDRASISFALAGQRVSLRFDASGLRPLSMWGDLPLVARLKQELSGDNAGLVESMNHALELINSAERFGFKEPVSDLVEIEVPFKGEGALAGSSEFVIFDTPGSNSATNADHQRILKDAMEGFSNGLPVYVCEYTSLDSTDNQKLYDDIKQIEALDERFTLIVVNKADSASLPRDGFSPRDRQQILSEAIPRSMYAQGIYFVSSIMGLGSKTGGEFENEFYAEKYEDQERKYTDPEARFYKQLYLYNIMPEQIKQRVVERAARFSNLMLANSGLLSIEDAMGMFAARYSSYNKCHQSEALLNRLIDVTSEEVEAAKQKRELDKSRREMSLERDKRELVESLDELVESQRGNALDGYHPHMDERVQGACNTVEPKQLDLRQNELVEDARDERGLDKARQNEKDRFGDIGKNLFDGAQDLFSSFDINKVSDIFSRLGEDISDAVEAHSNVDGLMHDANRAAARQLLEEIKSSFIEHALEAMASIEGQSQDYWLGVTKEARASLYRFVTESDYLDEEKRSSLSETITSYKGPSFDNRVNELFNEERLRGLWVGDIRLLDSDRLNVDYAAGVYNREMDALVKRRFEEIAQEHSSEFEVWLRALRDELVDNIVDYNPDLRNQDEIIRSDSEMISQLEAGMRMLGRYEEQVRQMMDWKCEESGHGNH